MAQVSTLSFAARWRVYFAERFPLLLHGVLVLAYVCGAIAYSARLHGQESLPGTMPVLLAFIISLLLFLQLRVLDEFKDSEDDARWRPYRPVPRGIVSLRALGVLGVFAAAIQFALLYLFARGLIVMLIAIWLYAGLMGVEFFVRKWLKAHAAIYMATHMVIVPMITFLITAFDWYGRGAPNGKLAWLLAMSYSCFCVIEIGRKIRAPADEEKGVETYSALWGPRRAVTIWLSTMALTGVFAVFASSQIEMSFITFIFALLLIISALFAGVNFLKLQQPGQGKRIELLSGLAALVYFLVPGIAPWLMNTGG